MTSPVTSPLLRLSVKDCLGLLIVALFMVVVVSLVHGNRRITLTVTVAIILIFLMYPLSMVFPYNAFIELTQKRQVPFYGQESHTGFEVQLQTYHSHLKKEIMSVVNANTAVPKNMPAGIRLAGPGTWRYLQLFCRDEIPEHKREMLPVLSALSDLAHEDIMHVGISIMEPRTVIPAHLGCFRGCYRILYPITVPKRPGACHITLRGERHVFEESVPLVFDDNFEHRVVNESNETRVVVFVDVRKRFANPIVNKMNEALTNLAWAVSSFSKAANERTENLV
jgi:diadenosine tetraphosphatase ApaH/serine/threonine PP2A family protein phosphatase